MVKASTHTEDGIRISESHQLTYLAFADDIVLFTISLIETQNYLDGVMREAKTVGLEINERKTEASWQMESSYPDEFTYLRSTITDLSYNSNGDIIDRRRVVCGAMMQLKHPWSPNMNPTKEIKM
ncbi:uncharacterized protein LOC115219931 [Octopus sinensis]|uniref:Uncharacterized protein LOC115219931 n=1 Tax=Octopus sinensis TaxID=2607531 RepID=A0A6P7T8G2_9MOLL|nr:uncharacterized protein LOC115219931 [Octopus sinensis]